MTCASAALECQLSRFFASLSLQYHKASDKGCHPNIRTFQAIAKPPRRHLRQTCRHVWREVSPRVAALARSFQKPA
eukprot:1457262-Amphidinium_carterae.1